VTAQLALWTAPAARKSDPPTSHAAAAAPTGALERLILDTFAYNGGTELCDDELCAQLRWLHAPTVKTARSRLSKRGLLVPTDKRRPSARGRDQIVWRLPA
jgi:hypothetical protein